MGSIKDLSIYNAQGRLMLNEKVNGTEIRIDTGSWPAGIYLVRLRSGQTVFREKFIKD